MFWHTSQRDYVAAVVSLTKIARFNGIVLGEVFREATDFLSGKCTKGVQCDFQPLLRLGELHALELDFIAMNSRCSRGCQTIELEVSGL